MATSAGTNLGAALSSTLTAILTDKSGLIVFGQCTEVPSADANIYEVGALVTVTTNQGTTYVNVGTSASPSWKAITHA